MVVKQRIVVRRLELAGFELVRPDKAPHHKFRKGSVAVAVPRHRELDNWTARNIMREAGLEDK